MRSISTTKSELVRALKIQTSDASLFGTKQNLEKPPGRGPSQLDVKLSAWYLALNDSHRGLVAQVAQEAAELAVFSFLSILDGVSAIEEGLDKGELRLVYVKGTDSVLLNKPGAELLHETYNDLCRSCQPESATLEEGRVYEVGTTEELRSKQTSKDGIDLHSIPSNGSISIALPKHEHRKL